MGLWGALSNGCRLSDRVEITRQFHGGDPLRVFYAFDPRRAAILLVAGNKTGDRRFYQRMIPLADRLYDEYIGELKREGLIE